MIFLPPNPADLPATVYMLQLLSQAMNAVPYLPAVNFQFGFPRPAAPNPSGQTGKSAVFRGEPGKKVFQLGQFHLEFPFPGVRSLGKDIQDQLSPVNYSQLSKVGDGTHLVW